MTKGRGEVARDADIDLDPPALREHREAAHRIAVAPDDPWTFAESLASPEEAAASAPDAGRCGDDERPQFDDPQERGGEAVTDQTRAAGPNYLAARARLDAALRASTDAFERAVADWLDVGQMRTPAGQVDALVQQAQASPDPRLYALAWRACGRARPATAACGALSLQRWAQLDAGNGVPWLHAFDAALRAGDAAGQREAMARLAAATRFDESPYAAAAAVAAHASTDDRDLAATLDLVTEAIGRRAADPLPVATLLRACRDGVSADASRAQQCQEIADTMFSSTDSLVLRTMAGGLQFSLTGDESRRRAVHAELEQAGKAWSPGTGFSLCGQVRDALLEIRRKGEIGELAALRERLQVALPP